MEKLKLITRKRLSSEEGNLCFGISITVEKSILLGLRTWGAHQTI